MSVDIVTHGGTVVAQYPDPEEPTHDERAVRLAAGWGSANLRLARVRAAVERCTPEDRRLVLAALDGPIEDVP